MSIADKLTNLLRLLGDAARDAEPTAPSAPPLWVCGACGRECESREALRARDTSCGTWAVQVDPATVVRDEAGKVVKADAIGGGP